MTKTEKFLEWWNDLETTQKSSVIGVSFVALTVLILSVLYPTIIIVLVIIGAIIWGLISLIDFFFINPPWQ